MLFAARFTDKPDIAERRAELLQAHFDWLANNNQVLVAGALHDDPAGNSLGGLWIIEADTLKDAEAVFQTDPFFANGLRAKVEIYYFKKANPEIEVRL